MTPLSSPPSPGASPRDLLFPVSALARGGDAGSVEDHRDGVAHVEHDVADRPGVLVGAIGAALIGGPAGAGDRRERPIKSHGAIGFGPGRSRVGPLESAFRQSPSGPTPRRTAASTITVSTMVSARENNSPAKTARQGGAYFRKTQQGNNGNSLFSRTRVASYRRRKPRCARREKRGALRKPSLSGAPLIASRLTIRAAHPPPRPAAIAP